MVYCAVYGCKSSNKSREKIVFHRFPNNTAEAAKWLKFCRRADSVNLKNAAICGRHFKPSDYRHNLSHELNPGQAESRPKLKRGAVPAVAPPDCNLEENDSHIRKKYLHGDSFAIQLQEEKRCKECGATFEDASSDSPMVMQNVTLENRGCNKLLPPLNLDNFDSHLEKNSDIFSEEPETIADLADTVCLVCDAVIKDSRTVGVLDLYSEASVTSHTQQRVVVMLAVLINIPLHSNKAYSKSLCQQCYRHLDELDEVQHRAAVIKANIENIYDQCVHKRHLSSSNDGDLESAMRETVLKNGEGTAIDSSSVPNNKVEAELPKVIRITNSTRTANPAVSEKDVVLPVGVPKPITIKVYETSQINPTGRGLPVVKNEPINQIKRKYRKRSEIVHLCKFCMKVFLTGEELKKHQKTHTTIECKFCGKILVRIGAWENHLKMFHNVEMKSNEDLRFSCDQCDKQFTSKSSIRYHMKLHEGKTYTCDKCTRVFSHPGTLRNHKLIHEEKKFICDKCGKGFRGNFHLIMHDNQTHRKARSWKCKYCEKAFARCATYREHVRSHCTRKASSAFLKPSILDKPDLGREDTQPMNVNGNLLFNEGCKMLSIEEVCADEEARIVVGERKVACEEQNFCNGQAELYAEEFVLSSDGNLMIDNLMGVK